MTAENPVVEGSHQTVAHARSDFEQDAFTHYDHFKAQGCDAMMVNKNYVWTGLKGSHAQVAATFHLEHTPVHGNNVIAVLDLNTPKKQLIKPSLARWTPVDCPTPSPYISPAFREAVKHHDKDEFKKFDHSKKVMACALPFAAPSNA